MLKTIFAFLSFLLLVGCASYIEDYKAEVFFHSKDKCFDSAISVLENMKITVKKKDKKKMIIISNLGVVNIAAAQYERIERLETQAKYFIKVTGDEHFCKIDVYNLVVVSRGRVTKMNELSATWANDHALAPLFERINLQLNEEDYR